MGENEEVNTDWMVEKMNDDQNDILYLSIEEVKELYAGYCEGIKLLKAKPLPFDEWLESFLNHYVPIIIC